jgi:predicted RND superfamily exporter protein
LIDVQPPDQPADPGSDRGGLPPERSDRIASGLKLDSESVALAADRLVAWRLPLALLGLVILAAAWPLSAGLRMNRTIDQMFAPDDPGLLAYQELRESFGGNAVVMLVYRDNELFTPAGIGRAKALSDRVQSVPGVRGVLSIDELNDVLGVIRPAGLGRAANAQAAPLLRDRDPVAREFDRLFVGYTHSSDHKLGSIVALLDVSDQQRGFADAVRGLGEITRDMPPGTTDAVLVGEPVLLEQGFDLIQRDGERLAWLTVALLSPCVLLLIRSLRFVVLQAIVILWSVAVTRALLKLLGFELSLVSSILTALVTVIAVTSVIHLGSAQRAFRQRGYRIKTATTRAIAWIMPPIFWACATDAAGFISLSLSGIAPVREFGVMMAIASMAVFAAILLFTPLMITGGSQRFDALQRFGQLFDPKTVGGIGYRIRKGALRLAVVMVRHRRAMIALTAVLLGIVFLGVNRLEIESSFLRNFRQSSPLVAAYQMVESEFSGAGVWDIVLDAPDSLSGRYMDQVRDLEGRLRGIEIDGQRLTKVLSLADADKIASSITLLRFAPPSARLAGMRTAIPEFSDALLVPRNPKPQTPDQPSPSTTSNPDDAAPQSAPAAEPHQRKLRIMLRSQEHIPAETKIAMIREVERVVQEQTSSPQWADCFDAAHPSRPGRVTGYYVLLARVVSQLIGDQWLCLLLSAVLVWSLLVLAMRSFTLASIALIPNILPVLAVLAILGAMGIKMNMGAAMIAAVSIGLSIDGSVHFVSNYQRKIARGRTPLHATLYAQKQIGLPLLMATIALVVGFSVLAMSEFVPTATFGILTAAALVTGTLTNLTLLPALLGGRSTSLKANSNLPTPPTPPPVASPSPAI